MEMATLDPITINFAITAAKKAFSMYQQSEAKNAGLTPEQLKSRIDGAHDIIKSNFQIIEKLSIELKNQSEDFGKMESLLELEIEARKKIQKKIRLLFWAQVAAFLGLGLSWWFLAGL